MICEIVEMVDISYEQGEKYTAYNLHLKKGRMLYLSTQDWQDWRKDIVFSSQTCLGVGVGRNVCQM